MDKVALILIMYLLSQVGLAQEAVSDQFKYKAIYELRFQPDSTDAASVKSESMFLYIGNDLSRFSSRGQAVGDSLRANAKPKDKSMATLQRMQAQIPPSDFNYSIFKHQPSGKIYYTEKVARDHFIYEEDLPLMEWQITPETGEIAGYKVQKATTDFAGRRYTAWFTPEIPFSDGPYKFSGLPGLILEVSDENDDYKFLLTNFQRLESLLAEKFAPRDHKKVTKNEFGEIKRNYDRNPFAALEQAGITIHFTPQQERQAKQEIKEKFEKNNNPIELE